MVRHGATQCKTNDSDTRCGKTWKTMTSMLKTQGHRDRGNGWQQACCRGIFARGIDSIRSIANLRNDGGLMVHMVQLNLNAGLWHPGV